MSSYIDTMLRPGERIIYQPHLSTFLLVVTGFMGMVSLDALAYFGLKAVAYTGKFQWNFFGTVPREDFVDAVFIILIAGILLYFSAKYLFDYFKTEIAVTDQRIIGRAPRLFVAFSLQPVDLPLADIEKVSYSTWGSDLDLSDSILLGIVIFIAGLLLEMVGHGGTVVALDKEGLKTKFRFVASPDKLEKQINQAASIGEVAAPAPAAAEAGGIGEKALHRQSCIWKIVVVAVLFNLVMGWIIWSYALPGIKGAKDVAKPSSPKASAPKAPDPKARSTQAPAPKTEAPKALTAKDYVQKGLKEKDLEQKIVWYSKAIELDPNYAAAYYNRAKIYLIRRQYDQAIAEYSQAIALKPDYPAAFNGRGNAYLGKKEYDLAINDYGKAIELKPDYLLAYSNRGNTYFEKKDYEQALIDYDQAVKLKGDNYWPYYRRAVIYNLKGDAAQARRDYDKARSLNPKTPDLVIN